MENKKCFLIAPSGYITQNNLDIAKKRLKNLGFEKIFYREDILSRHFDYAGSKKRRIAEINEAYSSEAEIIFSVIGGQGAIHLLEEIDYDLISKSKKILVGLSDITILLNSIYQKTGARCIHGSNIGKELAINEKTIKYLFKAIRKEPYEISFKQKDVVNSGKIEGEIVGGNIELLGRSLGTQNEINTDNKILFLEEFDMKSWRVLDILWQLKFAGKFDKIKGLILGKFINCGENIDDYINEFFSYLKVLIIKNQEIGHNEPNIAIPLGEKCVIDTKIFKWNILFD